MILLISTCKEKLHELEFVKPIENILMNNKIKFSSKNYLEIQKKDLENCSKIIICGTSLKDNEFLKNIEKFSWIKEFEKPILGICSGMQIISLVFCGKSNKNQEIGFYEEKFTKEFLGLVKEQEVYHLHNNGVTLPNNFENFTNSKIPQAIKNKSKNIFGVLFHPEVRNQEMIKTFIEL